MIFRILFLALFLAGSAVRAYYTRKLRLTIPDTERSVWERLRDAAAVEGGFAAVLLTAQGIFLSVTMVLYVFFYSWVSGFRLSLPDWLRWLGFCLGAASLPFLVWVHHTLGKHWSVSLELREGHRLVTGGPYRWVRHPMYTVHIVYFLAWVLVSDNLLLLVNYLLTITLIVMRIPREERMLLEEFGDEYRAYMRRTSRLLPCLHRSVEKDH